MYQNDFDVSQMIKTTDPKSVNKEIDRIFLDLYPSASPNPLDQAFTDVARLYRGEFPGHFACDTAYHDIQHVLDVTLAMARLIDGYERSRVNAPSMGADMFQLGVITALFHDCGYIRRIEDRAQNGAEYTTTHVSRGADFLKEYLPGIGMPTNADVAATIIHFTGYEVPTAKIAVTDPMHRLLGYLLGSADIIAQMADRCYLEKCRDRLYPEFVVGGIARRTQPDGKETVVFESPDDLILKTPGFYVGANKRLNSDLAGTFAYAERHFGGQNLYLEGAQRNIGFAESMKKDGDTSSLRRQPPMTLPD